MMLLSLSVLLAGGWLARRCLLVFVPWESDALSSLIFFFAMVTLNEDLMSSLGSSDLFFQYHIAQISITLVTQQAATAFSLTLS